VQALVTSGLAISRHLTIFCGVRLRNQLYLRGTPRTLRLDFGGVWLEVADAHR
jgi:hypothetical protein